MSFFKKMLFQCLLLALFGCAEDDLNFNKIAIAKYPENKSGAISFTFDDGYPSGYNIIAPLFEEYNYRASFFPIVGNIKDDKIWRIWKDLSLKGFEIGDHSLTHLNLQTVYDTTILKREIFDSYKILKEKIGKAPFTFVHPFHTTNPVVNGFIFEKHYATRLAPKGFCSWEAWPSNTGEQWVKSKIDDAISKGLWYVPCAHGIGDGWGPITEDFLRKILDYVKVNESKIFLGTFENVAKYVLERDNTQLVISNTENGRIVELRSILDPNVFDLPLLIVISGQGNSSLKISSLYGDFFSKRLGSDLYIYAKPRTILVVSSS